MSEHSLLGPSSLQRRFLCPGSYGLEGLCEPDSSDAADRGTELHAEVAQALKDGLHHEENGHKAIENPLISRCISIAHTAMESMDVPDEMIETMISLKRVHTLVEKGTIDLLLVEQFTRATIIDWKFTIFQPPTASENLQLAAYAVAVAKEFELSEVTVILYLPELDKISDFTYDVDALVRANNRIQKIVEGCQSAWAPLNPSQTACRFCRAWSTCPAALATSRSVEDLTFASLDSAMNADMSGTLKRTLVTEGIIRKVKQRAFQLLCSGATIKGAKLKQIRGKRVWAKGMDVTILRNGAEDLGKDAEMTINKQEILPSPNGLEQAWGKAKPVRDKIASMTEMENKGKRLEVSDD